MSSFLANLASRAERGLLSVTCFFGQFPPGVQHRLLALLPALSISHPWLVLVFLSLKQKELTIILPHKNQFAAFQGTPSKELYQQRSYFCHERRHSESDQTWIGLLSSTSEGR